jgi:hypothetical protein
MKSVLCSDRDFSSEITLVLGAIGEDALNAINDASVISGLAISPLLSYMRQYLTNSKNDEQAALEVSSILKNAARMVMKMMMMVISYFILVSRLQTYDETILGY